MRSTTISIVIAIPLLLHHATFAVAAEDGFTSAPIIVTATRTQEIAAEITAAISVITREEIEASQNGTIMELLQARVPGLDVSRNGGPGGLTSLFMRGSESDHMLVLIDGVRVAAVTSGGYNWAGLSPDQIERIEIVRGPGSTIHGSDAIGGIVQIFTRRDPGLYLSLSSGSYATNRISAGGGARLGAGRYNINLSHVDSNGFSATRKGAYGYEADDDGYRRTTISSAVSIPLRSDLQLDIDFLHSDGRNEYDDGSAAYADTVNSSGELRLEWPSGDSWSHHLRLNAAAARSSTHSNFPVEHESRRYGANWQGDLTLSPRVDLTTGIDLRQDNGVNSNTFDKTSDSRAAYAQYRWRGQRFDLLLGGRGDHHSEYGQHNSGNLALGGGIGAGHLYISYATAFKAPTFDDLYHPGSGDPELEPEKSATVELGYRLHDLRANIYRNEVDDLIQWLPSAPGSWDGVMSNIGAALIRGIELEYSYASGPWKLHSTLTLQRSEDRTSGKPLLRRAEKKMQINISGPLTYSGAVFGVEIGYTGPRKDFGDVTLSSYTLLNLTGEYRLAREWRLQGRVENLFDEEYQLADGYSTSGPSAYLTLSYKR